MTLVGICVQKQPIMIVMELVPGGSLLNYLRSNAEKLTTKALLGNVIMLPPVIPRTGDTSLKPRSE